MNTLIIERLGLNNVNLLLSIKQKLNNYNHFNYLFITNNSFFIIQQRNNNDIWKKLYELPLIESQHELTESQIKKHEPLFKNKENDNFVLDAMFKSTNEIYGTSYKSRIDDPKYQFAGKTGTAQVKRITEEDRELDLKTNQIPYKERDHAWYVAFGPYKEPRYAVSILVEHGGSGSAAAAPIAKKLFKFIIDRHDLREQNRKKYLINNNV